MIDSEDKYTICTNAVLHQYGKPSLPWHIKAKLQGRPGPEAGRIFREWAQLPISSEEMWSKTRELQKVEFPKCRPLPGVVELMRRLKESRAVEMALATSSQQTNFELKTKHLEDDLFCVFPAENRVLGDDERIGAGRGKPAPDIYLLALETINASLRKHGKEEITPAECLVFEDSVPGVESGRRAGMQVVWCPHEGLLNEYRGREKEVLAGLTGEHVDEVEEKNEKIGAVDSEGKERRRGAPGEIGDGWARLFHSLENFPYADYGIRV